jgi:hypothetical protein
MSLIPLINHCIPLATFLKCLALKQSAKGNNVPQGISTK